jgi:unspecific monooxygenase
MSGGDRYSRAGSLDSPPSYPAVSRPAVTAAGRPPGPRGRLLVGTLFDYEKDPLNYLLRCRDTYGDIFSLTPYHVVLCRPDWSQEVLARTNRELQFVSAAKTGRESFMTVQVGGWMQARRSAGWRRLGTENTAATSTRFRERLGAAFERMAAAGHAGVIDCQIAAADAAMDFFIADFDERLRQLVMDAADTVPALTRSSLDLPKWVSPSLRRFVRATDALVSELARRAAVRARPHFSRDGAARDVFDLLCGTQDAAGTGPAFTSLQIAQFLASSLTNLYAVTGAVLSWLLVVIARHPDITSDSKRESGHWAEAVVRETLRMYPPIWNLVRHVQEPVEFGGYRLAPGTTAVASPILLHYDQRWWREDPALFMPERWLDPRLPAHESHAYIPYGAGPRICLGAQLAQEMLTQAFDLLASSWQVSVAPSAPTGPPSAIHVPDPVRFTLTAR